MGIEPGDRVRIAYVGRTDGGTVFATSDADVAEEHGLTGAGDPGGGDFEPLTFTVGRGEVLEGLDEAIVGMSVGEEVTVRVPPAKGYGERDPERVREYDPATFESMVGRPPAVGLHVEAENGLHGDVTAVSDAVEVDFNHELAGQALVFDVRVLAVG